MTRKLESIIWLITGKCNLSCPYCYASMYRGEVELSLERVAEVVSEASEAGVEYINITGGEPLLRGDLVDIVKLIGESDIEVSVFSNLTLLTEGVAEKLAKHVDGFLTTIDGPRNVYESVKGAGSWDKFLRGLEALRKSGIDVHVNIPISKLNYNRAGEALRTAIELEIYSISVIPAMATGRAIETDTHVSSEEFEKAVVDLDLVASESGVTVSAWCSPFLGAIRGLKSVRYGSCKSWDVMDITPSGRVVLCDVTGLAIADVLSDGLERSWKKLREYRLANKIYEVPRECRSCPSAYVCRGGCYARSYLESGNFAGLDPLCPRASSSRAISRS